jgi:elongation factor 1-alpha
MSEKKHVGVVIVGHVDAGKSSLTGRLLFELGGISERDIEKLKAEAKAQGKDSFFFAYFMDRNKEERARGVTISCTTKEFFTKKFHYTIIDAPGHRDFIKNMISGASQADVAILMIPANRGGFETSIQKADHKQGKIQGQTRQHARLCFLLGIEQVICCVNKMDSVKYDQARFDEISGEVQKMIKKIGYKLDRVPFIPIAGFVGDNLTEPSKNMSWYKGFKVENLKGETVEGHTLVDALDKLVQEPKRNTKGNFRMPVSGCHSIKGVGDVITGRIEQGILTAGDEVTFIPSGITGKVFSIEMHHKAQETASPGDNVGVNVKNLPKEKKMKPKAGTVMVISSQPAPAIVKTFDCAVMVQEHPGQLKCGNKDGQGGFTPSIHVRTGKAPCRLSKIMWRKGKKTAKQKIDNPPFIEAGDTAMVRFEAVLPIHLEPFKECAGLGRVAAMDSNSLVMLGKVMAINKTD